MQKAEHSMFAQVAPADGREKKRPHFSGVGGGPFYGTGYYGGGGLGLIIVVILILVLLGRI